VSRALYLEGEFRPRATIRGGILMFRAADAVDLIQTAHARRVRVLGIDTFRLTERTTTPEYDHTLDLSGHHAESDWDEAIEFVRTRESDGLHFEVVLADEVATA
jgi:hypothetical protein